jgi:hypothetical protein
MTFFELSNKLQKAIPNASICANRCFVYDSEGNRMGIADFMGHGRIKPGCDFAGETIHFNIDPNYKHKERLKVALDKQNIVWDENFS